MATFYYFFPIGLSTCILMEIWTYMIYINDGQLFVTFQRKSTKTQFWSDVTKISWTQKPCSNKDLCRNSILHISNGPEIPLMSILKLFVDTFVSFLKREVIIISL